MYQLKKKIKSFLTSTGPKLYQDIKFNFYSHFLSYKGASLDKELRGKAATFSPLKFNTSFLVSVVFPIMEKSNPHLVKIFFAFSHTSLISLVIPDKLYSSGIPIVLPFTS